MFSIAAVFSDNMVLQRGKNVAVWGESDSGSRVRVSVAGSEAERRGKSGRQEHGQEFLLHRSSSHKLQSQNAL